MPTVSENLATAMQHHQAGRLQSAEQLYRQILQSNPNHVDALHLLGLIAHQTGNHQAAVELISRAIQLNGNAADAHSNLGLAYFAWRKIPEAITCYRRALKLQPNDAKVWMILGVALKDLGQFDEAATSLRNAIQLRPNFIEAHGNLGNVLREQGQLGQAIGCYRQVLSMNPNIAEAHTNLGTTLYQQGRFDEAIPSFRRAVELKPTYAEAYGGLGNALKDLGRFDEAVANYHRALELRPNLVEAHGNLGIALMEQGYPEQAIDSYRRALELRPDDPVTLSNLGNALTSRGRLSEAVNCFRNALEQTPNDATTYNNLGTALKDQGLLDDAIVCFRRAMELRPGNATAHSNLLMTLQYHEGTTPDVLLAEHREFDRQHSRPLAPKEPPRARNREDRQRPRLGFVSADFGRHPVGFFLIRAYENLSRDGYQIVGYSDRNVKDDFTRRFQVSSSKWHDTIGLSDDQLADQIRADEIDILFDLSGHTGHNRILVFARKPAPVQITWIGYEGTTGLSAMDYLIADRHVVPAGSEAHYGEKVLRMPDGYLCYESPDAAPPVVPPPSLKNGFTRFGSFNNLAKITLRVIEAWSKVLHRSPGSRLLMKYQGLGDPVVKQRYADAFAAHGISADRLELQGSSSYTDYLAGYGNVDLVLDPFPFSGSTTTCEALWMGVPVVTCPLETFASRHSMCHLSNVGLPETIAGDLDDYVEIAVKLSQDTARLQGIRSCLREQMRASPLCDGQRFARNLSSVIESIW